MNAPRVLYREAQVREIEAAAIAAGRPAYDLMREAAQAARRVLAKHWPQARRVALVCGGGNNGGDGLALARLLRAASLEVTVLAAFEPAQLGGEAAQAWRDLQGSGANIVDCTDAQLASLAESADVVVDALLGIGVRPPLRAEAVRIIEAINRSGRPVLSLDTPSGLDPDRGVALPAVRATVTVSFVALKQGLLLGDGPEYSGVLHLDPLGIDTQLPPALRTITDADVTQWLPRRTRNAHKADFGRLLVVGGGEGMPGAARLAGEAALRVGAGLVTVASLAAHAAAITGQRPELMFRAIADGSALAPLLPQFDVIAVGPGLGQTSWARQMLDAVLGARVAGQRLVLDADALNLLAQQAVPPRDDWVLTPHPGEAARLLGSSTAAGQGDRAGCLQALHERYGGVIVLKGAGTLVRGAGPVAALCERGNPGMAVPGMGDVLTGIIAGLLAQRADATGAAMAGVHVHATAGDRCARAGLRGILALDVAHQARQVLAELAP